MQVCAALVAALLVAAPAPTSGARQHDLDQLTTLQPGVRTTVSNSLWGNDAFPGTPLLLPGKDLTIGFWNASGGGMITEIHLVLAGPDRGDLQRHVALKITYDGLPYPSVFVPVGDFFMDQVDSASNNYENKYFAKRPTNSWHCFAPMPYEKSIKIELVSKSSKPVHTAHPDMTRPG